MGSGVNPDYKRLLYGCEILISAGFKLGNRTLRNTELYSHLFLSDPSSLSHQSELLHNFGVPLVLHELTADLIGEAFPVDKLSYRFVPSPCGLSGCFLFDFGVHHSVGGFFDNDASNSLIKAL